MPNYRQLVDNLKAMWSEISKASRYIETHCSKPFLIGLTWVLFVFLFLPLSQTSFLLRES